MTELKGRLNPSPLIAFDRKKPRYYKGIKAMSDTELHEQLFAILQNLLKAGEKPRVLDLGCGEGAFSQRLFDAGFNVTGADLKKEAFKAKGPDFASIDLNDENEKRDFAARNKGKYGVIFAVEVIEHLKNPWEFVSFLKQLCGQGTEVLVTTPNFASWWGRLMFLLYGELWGFDSAAWKDPGHINPLSATELSNILDANGFKLNGIYPCGKLPVIWLFNWKRAIISLLMLPFYLMMKGQKKGWALCFHAAADK